MRLEITLDNTTFFIKVEKVQPSAIVTDYFRFSIIQKVEGLFVRRISGESGMVLILRITVHDDEDNAIYFYLLVLSLSVVKKIFYGRGSC